MLARHMIFDGKMMEDFERDAEETNHSRLICS